MRLLSGDQVCLSAGFGGTSSCMGSRSWRRKKTIRPDESIRVKIWLPRMARDETGKDTESY